MSTSSSTQKYPGCLHDLKYYSTLFTDVIITFQRKVYKFKELKEFVRGETKESLWISILWKWKASCAEKNKV